MINGVRVRDSGVELSPTGTDRRPENGIQPHGSSFFGNRGRIDGWLMRRTKRRLSATPEDRATHGHPWPPLYSQVAHCYALVKTSTRGSAQGLPAAFPRGLNRN